LASCAARSAAAGLPTIPVRTIESFEIAASIGSPGSNLRI